MDVLILEVGGHRGQSWHTLHLRDKPPRALSVDRRQTQKKSGCDEGREIESQDWETEKDIKSREKKLD